MMPCSLIPASHKKITIWTGLSLCRLVEKGVLRLWHPNRYHFKEATGSPIDGVYSDGQYLATVRAVSFSSSPLWLMSANPKRLSVAKFITWFILQHFCESNCGRPFRGFGIGSHTWDWDLNPARGTDDFLRFAQSIVPAIKHARTDILLPWRGKQHVLPNCKYLPAKLQRVTAS